MGIPMEAFDALPGSSGAPFYPVTFNCFSKIREEKSDDDCASWKIMTYVFLPLFVLSFLYLAAAGFRDIV